MVVLQRLQVVFSTLWLGFILAISFMEAWLKFLVEGVSRLSALRIGQLVFTVLNKVELFFLSLLILLFFYSKQRRKGSKIYTNCVLLLVVIMTLQTVFLLPVLDHRLTQMVAGITIPNSHIHLYYVCLEVVKLISLCVLVHYNLKAVQTLTKI